MNCRKFETIINDLARGSVMEAALREDGLAHAKACARCDARLIDEKSLTLGLRAAHAAVDGKEAPAHVEAALLSAFRERRGVPDAPAHIGLAQGGPIHAGPTRILGSRIEPARAESASVVPMSPGVRRQRPVWYAGAAVAAMVLFALGLGILSLQRQQSGPSRPAQEAKIVPATVAPDENHGAVAAVLGPEAFEEEGAQGEAREGSDVHSTVRPRMAMQFVSNTPRRGVRRFGPEREGEVGARPSNAASGAGETEIATDFMPLTYDDGGPMESGHVVRVELPRSALVSMGLPMNAELAGQPVKADVLLGDDGVARAIRFVR